MAGHLRIGSYLRLIPHSVDRRLHGRHRRHHRSRARFSEMLGLRDLRIEPRRCCSKARSRCCGGGHRSSLAGRRSSASFGHRPSSSWCAGFCHPGRRFLIAIIAGATSLTPGFASRRRDCRCCASAKCRACAAYARRCPACQHRKDARCAARRGRHSPCSARSESLAVRHGRGHGWAAATIAPNWRTRCAGYRQCRLVPCSAASASTGTIASHRHQYARTARAVPVAGMLHSALSAAVSC